jgi:hypothetical protein
MYDTNLAFFHPVILRDVIESFWSRLWEFEMKVFEYFKSISRRFQRLNLSLKGNLQRTLKTSKLQSCGKKYFKFLFLKPNSFGWKQQECAVTPLEQI